MTKQNLPESEDTSVQPPLEHVDASDNECVNSSQESSLSLEQIQQKLVTRRQSQPATQLPDPVIDRHAGWKKWRKPVLTAFIAWNLVAVTLHLCAPSIFRDKLVAYFNPYLWYMGLWQDFCVFVPNPKDYNINMSANVVMRNGQVNHYIFPNPSRDDHFTRMFTERFRKWAHDNVNQPNYKVWWPDTCRWIARKYVSDPQNLPQRVELIRNFREIKPPGSQQVDGPEQSSIFYTYVIQPGDL